MQAVAACLGAGWVSGLCCLVGTTAAATDRTGDASGFPGPDKTVLRLARSNDGLHFEDTGEVLPLDGFPRLLELWQAG